MVEKEDLDKLLTCSVCLDQYENPKMLPKCHHSFCLVECLESLPVKAKRGKLYIECPICKTENELPPGGVKELDPSFYMNGLLDVQKKIGIAQPTCPDHKKPLTTYCEPCDEVICHECVISKTTKHVHSRGCFHLISECYPDYYRELQKNLGHVKHKLIDMTTAMTLLETRERVVFQQGENVKEQINAHAEQLINKIKRSQARLIEQVDTTVHQKRQTLATQRQQAQKIHTEVQACHDKIEHSLKQWNEQQILTAKTIMMNNMKLATQHVDPAVFQPMEDVNIQHNRMEKEMGSITRTAYDKATLEVLACIINQPSTATLTLHSQDGSPFSLPPSLISCTLTSLGKGSQSVKCPVTQTQPGKYDITFTPCTRNDTLIVQVGGVDVPDSPFTLKCTPEVIGKKPVDIMLGLNQPHDIAVCDDGDIMVVEHGAHHVPTLNQKEIERKQPKRILGIAGEGKFRNLRGIAISQCGYLLVTDHHRLQKLTSYGGLCIKSIGSTEKGNGQLQFNYPRGIAVHPTTGQIFVADSGNNRVQVFNDDLTFSHTMQSTFECQFNNPYDIAIDYAGHCFVADAGNNCVTQFDLTYEDEEGVGLYPDSYEPTAMMAPQREERTHIYSQN